MTGQPTEGICPDCGAYTYQHCTSPTCTWTVCYRRSRCGGYGVPGGRWLSRKSLA